MPDTFKRFLEFAESCKLSKKMTRAAVLAFGGFPQFNEVSRDVNSHGIDGSFGHYIYYKDTVPFGKRHWADYKIFLKEVANDLGEPSVYKFLSGYKCMEDITLDEIIESIYVVKQPLDDDVATLVFNCIAWGIGEDVCRHYVEFKDAHRIP